MRWAVAAVALAACTPDGMVSTGAYEAEHQECVEYTNTYRVDNGRAPVVRDEELEDYADEGAEHDHDASPHDHFIATSGGGIAFAENECPHWDLSFGGGDLTQLVRECIDAYVSEGPGGGHYENLMGDYGSLGCGIYVRGTDATIIQDFGR